MAGIPTTQILYYGKKGCLKKTTRPWGQAEHFEHFVTIIHLYIHTMDRRAKCQKCSACPQNVIDFCGDIAII